MNNLDVKNEIEVLLELEGESVPYSCLLWGINVVGAEVYYTISSHELGIKVLHEDEISVIKECPSDTAYKIISQVRQELKSVV